MPTAGGPIENEDTWDFTGANGEHLALHLTYDRGVARKLSAETKFFSAADPSAYQIWKVDQGLDIMRNATVPVKDRVKTFEFKASGGRVANCSMAASASSASMPCTGTIAPSLRHSCCFQFANKTNRGGRHDRPRPAPSIRYLLLAGAMLVGAPAWAGDVTPDRLVNADKEPQNWLMNHRTYDAQRFSPLDKINKDNVKNLKLAYAVAIGGTVGEREPRSDAAGRGRLPLRRRPMGRALQDRRPLRRRRPHRLAHGSRPGEGPAGQPRRRACGAISSSRSRAIRRA